MYLGIDIGTTNCKLGLVSEVGFEFDIISFKTPVILPKDGYAEYDCNEIWRLLTISIKQLINKYQCHSSLKGIAISSQGESGLFVDKNGEPLMNAIAWYDNRTKVLMEEWSKRISPHELKEITGLDNNFIHSILKIEWIKKYYPAIYNIADKWHCLSDFIVRKMTGEAIMDYSLASRTMAFDIKKKDWSQTLLDITDIYKGKLPKPVQSGTVINNIKSDICKEWEINTDVKVVAGGFDHMCGCYGLDVNDKKQAVVSIGTTESLCLYSDKSYNQNFEGFSSGCHVFNDSYYLLGGMPAGGETIEWAIETFISEKVEPENYDLIRKILGNYSPGENNLMFLPHLKGTVTPVVDTSSKGMFVGITKQTTKSDFINAIVEGMCFEFRLIVEQVYGGELESLVAIGGGVKNKEWMQMKADTLNKKIIVPVIKDAVVFGAARLASNALGVGFNLESTPAVHIYHPNKENVSKYDQRYNSIYKKLYPLNKKILQESE